MKRITSLLVCFLFIGLTAFSQDIQITGTVTDASTGDPLPGVSVVVKGTTVGASTNVDGQYSISVPQGAILEFSSIGMASQEIEVGSQTVIDVQLAVSTEQIEELVVTALGISKEKKALGYAVSSVNSEEIEGKPEADIGRILSGKASGVKVTSTGGVAGSGTNITIRGYSSITGGNQPLFIVDGVPFSGSTNSGTDAEQGFLEGNQATSSRFLDLDANNIENVSILKGLSATALYGNEGRNGVILITTKSGSSSKKGLEVSVSQSVYVNQIASLPDYQDRWSNGFHQDFGFFFSNWGADMSTPFEVAHPYSRFQDPALIEAFPEYQDAMYTVKPYNNVEDFFRKGLASTTSVGISGGDENASFQTNFSYLDETGFIPGNDLTKFNIGVGGRAKLANKLVISGSFNYVKTDMQTPPISYGSGSGTGNGSGISVFADVFYTPRSVDLHGLPYEHPTTHESVYYRSGNDIQNPIWTTKYAKSIDMVNRFYGNGALSYEIMEGLSAVYNYGVDFYVENQEYQLNKGSVQNDDYVNGLYRTRNINNLIATQQLMINYTRDITETIGIDAMIGANHKRETYQSDGMESTNQLVFGFMRHSNFKDHAVTNSFNSYYLQSKTEANTLAMLASATVDYDNYLFVTLTGRNEWFSSLQPENRSIFYPSASVSFIPTTAFSQITSPMGLNYLKLRFGYGTSAGFPPLYTTENIYGASARAYVDREGNVVSTNAGHWRLGNPNLKPELHSEIELGIEAAVLNNRLDFELTLYQKNTKDLITEASLDPSTGYQRTFVNVGKLQNRGVEFDFHAIPVQFSNFKWEINGVFTKYESIVKELGAGQDKILIAGFTNQGNYAFKDEPYGVLYTDKIKTNENGDYIVDDNGHWLTSDDPGIVGNPHPDFETSLVNSLHYKGFSFSFQFEYRKGGDIYSGTTRALIGRGLTKDTDFDRSQTFVLPGVRNEGTADEPVWVENDVQVTATNAYFNNLGMGPAELQVYDGTTIRLSEISLSYKLPEAILGKTPFGSASLTVSGHNMWYKAVNFPEHINFDPNVLSTGVGNGLGMDFITGPSVKRYGASLKLTF